MPVPINIWRRPMMIATMKIASKHAVEPVGEVMDRRVETVGGFLRLIGSL